MTKNGRILKQILVAAVFLLIIGGIGYGGYRLFSSSAPIPTPDQTAGLVPLKVMTAKILNVENSDYDFTAKIFNPNTRHGSGNVEYELSFFDEADNLIASKPGTFYISPGQTKYIIDSPIKLPRPIAKPPVFSIRKIDWQELNILGSQNLEIGLKTQNVSFNPNDQGGTFAKVGGNVVNSSDLDLNKVDVLVALLDQDGSIIAVNKTDIRTFLAKTSRGFEVSWFSPFVGQVASIDAEADSNVFEDDNFLLRHGGQERFQRFY